MESRNADTIELQVKELLEVLRNDKPNYIFGCGWMGRKFLCAVCALGFQVSGFVVTDKKTETEEGIPVFSLIEMENIKTEANIFVALRDQDGQLNERLQNIFTRVYPITYPKDITLIEAAYYLDYFKKRQVDCLKGVLDLNGYQFLNPFCRPDDYLLSWLYEAGDLILPVICNDYSRIDEGSYEREHTELKEKDIVLDCGANIGLFSAIGAQKGCMCYAFEPMPDAIRYLEEVRELFPEHIKICPYALADKEGKAVFHVQNNDLIGASLLENNNIIDKEYNVNVTTIDQFVQKENLERVDYIKADIEGSERNMLWGASDTIKRFHPRLSICTYHLPDDTEVLEGILREIEPEYVIKHQWKKLYAYVPE